MGLLFEDWIETAVAEYAQDAIDEINKSGNEAQRAIANQQAGEKIFSTINDLSKLDHDHGIPPDVKEVLQTIIILNMFNGAAPLSDLPKTAAEAWHLFNDLPENIGDGTKQDFFKKLAQDYPNDFFLDTNGNIIEPFYVIHPPEKPNFSYLYNQPTDNPIPDWRSQPDLIYASKYNLSQK